MGIFFQGRREFPVVMAVHFQRVPAEGFPLFLEGFEGADLRGAAIPLQVVMVDDGGKVAEAELRREERPFPDGAFLGLAVADQSIDLAPVACLLKP